MVEPCVLYDMILRGDYEPMYGEPVWPCLSVRYDITRDISAYDMILGVLLSALWHFSIHHTVWAT